MKKKNIGKKYLLLWKQKEITVKKINQEVKPYIQFYILYYYYLLFSGNKFNNKRRGGQGGQRSSKRFRKD